MSDQLNAILIITLLIVFFIIYFVFNRRGGFLQGLESGNFVAPKIKLDGTLERFKSHPRFQNLLREIDALEKLFFVEGCVPTLSTSVRNGILERLQKAIREVISFMRSEFSLWRRNLY